MRDDVLTIAQLQHKIKRGLESVLDPSYWVVAEIGGVNVAANGHCYLELVEREQNSSYTKAKVSAAIWRYKGSALEYKFISTTSTPLTVGMKILVCAKVSYHELYGLSLVIVDIEPSFTLGEAERIRRETIERLDKEGLLDLNSSLEIPSPIRRVAVVSSSKAAGYGDFCNELFGNGNQFDYHVELFDSLVQGVAAEGSIIASLHKIYQRANQFDVIVIIRGGGSNDDLSLFNSYELCATLATSPLVVIAGIGHDRDQSIADMVAAISVKTPTAVARFLIDSTLECDNSLLELSDYLLSTFKEQALYHTQQLDNSQLKLRSSVQQSVAQSANLLFKAEQLLSRNSQRLLHGRLLSLEQLSGDIAMLFSRKVAGATVNLEQCKRELKSLSVRGVEVQKNSLDLAAMQLRSFDPKRIVEMGYAIAKLNGKLLRSGKELQKGDMFQLQLLDAEVTSEVKEINSSKK